MYETKPYFYGTGRRKHSVARVRVYNGTGKMTINGRDINDYFGLETLKLLANSPLVLTENEGKFDVVVNVVGGGCAGQAGAIRHGLSRALLQFNPELRSTLMAERPEFAMQKAVNGMIPDTTIGRAARARLRVYAGADHKHAAQKPETLEF